MERVVGAEVGLVDLVLAVGVSRDQRHDLIETVRLDDRQLHLDLNVIYIRPVLHSRVIERCRRLAAVDDLEVVEALDAEAAFRHARQFYCRRGGGYAVVVGEEPVRLVENRAPDSLINLAPGLEE